MNKIKPTLFTSLSPALLNLYEISSATVVIIDVLRATSTIATALYNGAKSVFRLIALVVVLRSESKFHGITAGERDGKVAEGLIHGNSPFEYPREFYRRQDIGAYYNEWHKTLTNGIG
jgi:2-phosphosulfolactate phosphatase